LTHNLQPIDHPRQFNIHQDEVKHLALERFEGNLALRVGNDGVIRHFHNPLDKGEIRRVIFYVGNSHEPVPRVTSDSQPCWAATASGW